ncbi:hypothetical protein [Williamsia serinedens]|uniref:Holliday junction resolvase n=1 Tax=Williamsia serinedens TaxID=391736 RepID=A0ABT1H609_9NOCA|nr:hypothetical protein [Williamsia serinedens]MCP2162674.1 hypothetical protein [Williamsia serinedens]
MTRNRASARKAGTAFETQIATTLATHLDDDRIERRAKTGAKDRGDIGGVRVHGQRVVLECKNTARTDLARWAREAHDEAGNDDALVGLVVHKRHGNAQGLDQWVTCTVADLIALLTGRRPEEDQ